MGVGVCVSSRGVCVSARDVCVCLCVCWVGVCVCVLTHSVVSNYGCMCVFAHMRAYSLSWDPGL